jgi:hypothetical protein
MVRASLVSEITSAKTIHDVEAPGRRLRSILDRGGEWTSLVEQLARRDNKAATALESAMVLREKALADLVGWDHLATTWCRFYQLHDEWDRWAEQVVIGLLPPMAALSTQEAWTLVRRLLDTTEDDTVISVIGAGPIEDLLSSDPETVAALIYTCWPVQAHEYPSTLDIEGALLRVTRPLSDQQLKCLGVIDDVWPETITPARLATRLEVPTNTAVAYVAILVNRGYVTRTPQQRGISYLFAKSASTSLSNSDNRDPGA